MRALAIGFVLCGCVYGCMSRLGFEDRLSSVVPPGNGDNACTPPTPLVVSDDAAPPVVRIETPADTAVIEGTVEVRVSASDDLAVLGVRLALGGILLGAEDHAEPYAHILDTTRWPDGMYTLEASARDAAGNIVSDAISIVIDNNTPGTGQFWYACDCGADAAETCLPGAPLNSGTEPGDAIASEAEIKSVLAGLQCGDALLFCRGGVLEHTTPYVLPDLDCPDNQPLVLGAYTPDFDAGGPRPVLRLTGSNHGFTLPDVATPRSGYLLRDLNITCESCVRDINRAGVHLDGDDSRKVTLQRVRIEGFAYGILSYGITDLLIEYSHFVGNKNRGTHIVFEAPTLRWNLFENNGCIDATDDAECFGDMSINIGEVFTIFGTRIEGNEVTRTSVDSAGRCNGLGISTNSGGIGSLIINNYVHEPLNMIAPGCGGIQAIGSNEVANTGCQDCTISGNRLENVASGIVLGTHVGAEVFNNLILMPESTAPTPCVGVQINNKQRADHTDTTAMTVFNNSIFMNRADDCVGIVVQTEGSDHTVANNAIWSLGTGELDCFRFDAPANIAAETNNMCAGPNSASFAWVNAAGDRYDLPGWQTATGHGTASMDSPPNFWAPEPPFYDLSPEPCAEGSGIADPDLCPPQTVTGEARNPTSACNVGAY